MRSCSRSSSIRTSPTPRSSSVCDTVCAHPLRLDDARHRDDLVAAHDERPAVTVGARDLGVDEHVLHLLRAAGEPVAGPPPPYSKAWQPRFDAPRLPRRPGRSRSTRPRLEPQPVVLAHRLHAAAEVDALRADRRRRAARRAPAASSAARRARAGRSRAPRDGSARAAAATSSRIRPRSVSAFDESLAPLEAALAAVRLGLLAPDAEERPDDAVLAPDLDALRRPARGEPVEDRLDLVGERVPGRAQLGRRGTSSARRAAPPRSHSARRPARPRRRSARRTRRASASDSAPRRPWSTCSADTR